MASETSRRSVVKVVEQFTTSRQLSEIQRGIILSTDGSHATIKLQNGARISRIPVASFLKAGDEVTCTRNPTQAGQWTVVEPASAPVTAEAVSTTGSGSGHNPVTLDGDADEVLSLSIQEIGLDRQEANTGFFGPAGGADAVPTFRHMVNADMPVDVAVMLISGSTVTRYSADAAGLTSALLTASSGDTVVVPPRTYAANYTVPEGVAMVGISRESTIITGELTLEANSALEFLTVSRVDNGANTLRAVTAPTAGTARVHSCNLEVNQSGGGDAYAVAILSNGSLEVWNSLLWADSGGGNGYGGYRDTEYAGSLYVFGGRCYGSTGPFNE